MICQTRKPFLNIRHLFPFQIYLNHLSSHITSAGLFWKGLSEPSLSAITFKRRSDVEGNVHRNKRVAPVNHAIVTSYLTHRWSTDGWLGRNQRTRLTDKLYLLRKRRITRIREGPSPGTLPNTTVERCLLSFHCILIARIYITSMQH